MAEGPADRSGVVLAGGRGERMGTYKPLVPFRGRPLVAWSADALRPLASEIVVAVGDARNAEALARALPGARLVADDLAGPLGGLLAAARAATGRRLLVAPADAPLLQPHVYETLLASRADASCFTVDGHLQPLVAVLPRRVVLDLGPTVGSVRDLLLRADAETPEAGDLAPLLADVDDPAALARAEARGA